MHRQTVGRDQDVQNYPNIQSQYNNQQARGFLTKLKSVSAQATGAINPDTWLDSGASDHFVLDRKLFPTYQSHPRSTVSTCSEIGTIFGRGQLQFQLDNGTTSLTCLQVPDFKENIISLSKLAASYEITIENSDHFRGYILTERNSSKLVHKEKIQDGLCPFAASILPSKKTYQASSATNSFLDLHRKLGHIGVERVMRAMKKEKSKWSSKHRKPSPIQNAVYNLFDFEGQAPANRKALRKSHKTFGIETHRYVWKNRYSFARRCPLFCRVSRPL